MEQRRAEKGLDMSRDDVAYREYLDVATGQAAQREAGVVKDDRSNDAAADFNEVGYDQAYGAYLGELDGTSAQKRLVEAERQHQRDRERKTLQEAQLYGRPLPVDMEHLRPRLRDAGY